MILKAISSHVATYRLGTSQPPVKENTRLLDTPHLQRLVSETLLTDPEADNHRHHGARSKMQQNFYQSYDNILYALDFHYEAVQQADL
ncbi:hypothetical protein Tco_0893954 [Tanacetum coccineum]|uniref:Uncharacterized protein n=1 Tax=Tanacetum coccineum TaxID=301880 RepID=A0ABQ5CD60_9ASTR